MKMVKARNPTSDWRKTVSSSTSAKRKKCKRLPNAKNSVSAALVRSSCQSDRLNRDEDNEKQLVATSEKVTAYHMSVFLIKGNYSLDFGK